MSERLSPILAMIAGAPAYWCPGCRCLHRLPVVSTPNHNGDRWTYDGNVLRPTFHPSVHWKTGHYADHTPADQCRWCNPADPDDYVEGGCRVCHSWVRAGHIQFLDDSTHELKGQTVAIPNLPDWLGRKVET